MGREFTMCSLSGNFGCRTPASLPSPNPAPDCAMDQLHPDLLKFLPFAEWNEGGECDEQPPRKSATQFAWRLLLNRMTVGRVTEDDLVVAPSDCWEETLKADVEALLQTKNKRYWRAGSEGMAVTVKVNDRTLKKSPTIL